MKVIANTESIKLRVNKNELIEGKWIPVNVVSEKIAEYEKNENIGYKALRVRFYNSKNSSKYNTNVKYNIPCIDTDNPMKTKASLELIFEKV